MTFWPFWLGAIGLATASSLYLALTRRPLGVSGFMANALDLGLAREEARGPIAMGDLERALEEATRRQFGSAEKSTTPLTGFLSTAKWSTDVLFLVGIVVGACIAAVSSGSFHVTFDPGADFARLVAHTPMAYAALLGGGALVGFGTKMAGGCTSGHGLVGCSRLQPGSLVSTACFFGLAIVVSFVLEKL